MITATTTEIKMGDEIRLTGDTYRWKSELKAAGLRWNSQSKTWGGEVTATGFALTQLNAAIEDGELHHAATTTASKSGSNYAEWRRDWDLSDRS